MLSLKDEIERGNNDKVIYMIKKLYRSDGADETIQMIRADIIKNFKGDSTEDEKPQEQVGVCKVLTHKKYRKATFIGITLPMMQ